MKKLILVAFIGSALLSASLSQAKEERTTQVAITAPPVCSVDHQVYVSTPEHFQFTIDICLGLGQYEAMPDEESPVFIPTEKKLNPKGLQTRRMASELAMA